MISNCLGCRICAASSASVHPSLWVRPIKETRRLILFINAAGSVLLTLPGTCIASLPSITRLCCKKEKKKKKKKELWSYAPAVLLRRRVWYWFSRQARGRPPGSVSVAPSHKISVDSGYLSRWVTPRRPKVTSHFRTSAFAVLPAADSTLRK